MSMTRKHYQQIADKIYLNSDFIPFSEIGIKEIKLKLGELFTPIFEADNPRFDAAIFLKRCTEGSAIVKSKKSSAKQKDDYSALWGELKAHGIFYEGMDKICNLESITKKMETMSKEEKLKATQYLCDKLFPEGLEAHYAKPPYIGFNLCKYFYDNKKAAEIAVLFASIRGLNPMSYGTSMPPYVTEHKSDIEWTGGFYWTAVTG